MGDCKQGPDNQIFIDALSSQHRDGVNATKTWMGFGGWRLAAGGEGEGEEVPAWAEAAVFFFFWREAHKIDDGWNIQVVVSID